jgi:cytochrome c
MMCVLAAAAFVRHNMPFGTTFDAHVAAYINSLDQPTKANLEKENRSSKKRGVLK